MHIAVTRMDNIGDAVLTFPMLGIIRNIYPNCRISFIGRLYVKPVLSITSNIDNFIDIDVLMGMVEKESMDYIKELNIDILIHLNSNRAFAKIAYVAGIGIRIGSVRRLYNLFYCNRLVYFLDHRKSTKHVSDRNIKFLKHLGGNIKYSRIEKMKLSRIVPVVDRADCRRKNVTVVIVHPGSNEHGAEWPQHRYCDLISSFELYNNIEFYVTGTATERGRFGEIIKKINNVKNATDVMGKYTLEQMIKFLSIADVVISSSTGIAHLASVLDVSTITLFPSRSSSHGWSITSKQWAPIGDSRVIIEPDYSASNPRVGASDIDLITVEEVKYELDALIALN